MFIWEEKMYASISLYMCFPGCVHVGGWDSGILWDAEWCGSVSAIIGSSKLWKTLCFPLSRNPFVFDSICVLWWRLLRCVNDMSNKFVNDDSWKNTAPTRWTNEYRGWTFGNRGRMNRMRVEGGNEPWSEVKSRVEAHLLQSDESKTNEAQKKES